MAEVPLLHAGWPAPRQVLAFTTLRSGGVSEAPFDSFNLALHVEDKVSAVAENRRRLLRLLPADCSLQWLQQVHGTAVAEAGSDAGAPEADAAVVRESGQAAAVLTADCLPVFLFAAEAGCAAVAHAGWRGLQAGVLEATLARMAVPASEVMAWLGPAIGPCHFEVGGEVREAFLDMAVQRGMTPDLVRPAFVSGGSAGKWRADLYLLARAVLYQQGVRSLYGGGLCTVCDSRFYSFRRQARTGRMASLICLKSGANN